MGQLRFLPSTTHVRVWVFFLILPTISAKAQRFVGYSSQVQKANLANTQQRLRAERWNTDATKKDNPFKPSGKITWQAALLADGDFSKALSAEEGATPKTGSLGASFTRIKQWKREVGGDSVEFPNFQGNFVISLGSQGDTLNVQPNVAGIERAANQYNFGQALLLPGSNAKAARSLTGSVQWYPHALTKSSFMQSLGYNAFLNITQTRWGYQNRIEDVRLLFMSAGLLYTVFDIPTSDDSNSLKLELLLNYSLRHIAGDIREEKEVLQQALGTTRYWYSGIEPGMVFTVNSLRVSAYFPFYQGNIKGFSNGQFVAALGFSTALNLTK
ncbi:hypothetical protein MUN82_16915 [Hymenobacter aerilatus]|uniref:Uncharacterized protein n=1 Tax=Hymenobacter aerilatus TaxID=2932251 RepID=A0A8T9SS91_9BACT|nr:hypothetical protein [Hymenobacter aerilatus]UOR04617.1 hypothetical protein MUN82_16915 [Hymenobacter aerilatus]